MLGFGPRTGKAHKAIAPEALDAEALLQQINDGLIQRSTAFALLLLQCGGKLIGKVANGQVRCTHSFHIIDRTPY